MFGLKLMSFLTVVIVFCGSASGELVTLQEGVDGYTGTDDVWLSDVYSTGNLGGNDKIITRNESSAKSTSLIKFDLSGIPSGAEINSATLKVYNCSARSQGATTVYLNRMLRDWVEGTGISSSPDYANGATWNYYEQSPENLAWDAEGGLGAGDSVSTPSDTASYGWYSAQWVTFDVTADVAGFVSGQFDNYGWVLNNAAGKSDQRFYSSEYSDSSLRPILEVEYVPEPATMCLFSLAGAAFMKRSRNR